MTCTFQHFATPAAPTLASILPSFLASDENTVGPDAQPAVPRNLTVFFPDSWDGGAVTVAGLDAFGSPASEAFTPDGAHTVTREGAVVFSAVTAISKAKRGRCAQPVSVGTGGKLGLSFALAGAYGLLARDGMPEPGTWDATYHAVTPATRPDGARSYDVIADAA